AVRRVAVHTLAPTLTLALCLPAQQDANRSALLPAAPGGAASAQSAEREIAGLLRAAQNGDVVAFWDWLPTSYQRDVDGLVRELATRVDAKVWERAVGLLGRAADVALRHQDHLLATPTIARALADEPAARPTSVATFRATMTLLRELAASDVRTAAGLARFDGRAFLRQTGEPLLRGVFALARARGHDPIAHLARAEIRTLRQTATTARLETRVPGQVPETEDYTLVEGHWLPVRLVRDWDRTIGAARERLAALPPGGDRELMAQARFALGVVEGYVRKFEDAETQAEFDEVAEQLAALAQRGGAGGRRR
ncbi:MAG: hypothetical protein KDE27_13060, partial [Planctomycetes bacterium]|nr:hypothetical protein [Planctomycetota bacterium]